MSNILFDKIGPNQVVNAAKYIDEHGVPADRLSRDYDVWINDKTYPPPYILAVVNHELGGEWLKLSDFGNNTSKAFQYLEDAGFRVMPKWVALHREIGEKLSTYRADNSDELVKILKQVGITVGTDDKDIDGNTIPLTEIDPFTFLCCFNKFGGSQRSKYFENLKEIWGLKSIVSKDFPGVPSSNPQNTWLFAYSYLRKESDIPSLWQLFNELRGKGVTESTFEQCLEIKQTGQAKLTEVLFDYDPFNHLCLNKQTIPYLKDNGVNPNFKSFQDYNNVLNQVREKIGENFVNVSKDAWVYNTKKAHSYFFFKSNPEKWDLIKHLKMGDVDEWTVTKLKNHIDIGDKVILWKIGQNEGVYGLAEITTEITKRDFEIEEKEGDWKDDSYKKLKDKVGIEVIHNLVERPILWEEIEPSGLFKKLPQGTNFKATKEQYQHLLEMIEKRKDSKKPQTRQYFKCAPGADAVFWDEFKERGVCALGWDDIGDYNQYADAIEIGEAMGLDGSRNNPPFNIELFTKSCQPGDVIFSSHGVNWVLDVGIVEGPCLFDDSLPRNKNYRKVNWLGLETLKLEDMVHEIGYINLFRPDTFHRVKPYAFILSKYVEAHPEYAEIFDQYDLPYSHEVVEATVPVREYKNPNIILFGPPGTGKTYSTIDMSVHIATGEDRGHEENKKIFDELRASGQIEFITFHQNYAYEDFVVGMRPDTDQEILRFRPHKGIFYEMCKKAKDNYEAAQKGMGKKRTFDEVFQEIIQPLEEGLVHEVPIRMKSGVDFYITEVSDRSIFFRKPSGGTGHTLSISTLNDIVDGVREFGSGLTSYYAPLVDLIHSKQETTEKAEPKKNFVLIIDEINRGNISRIFGELITLLEDDKRLGQDNELKVTLPNGEKGFSVPPNLYLLGTMNTADKSIALLDIALRRRFEFIGKYPEYDDLTPLVQEKLSKLNTAIAEAKKSPDFMIGHAYFINKPDNDFDEIMNRKIIPLLYEYFNGRDEFVKRILDNAEIAVKKNNLSLSWEVLPQ
jgi:hypothetical protein